VVALIPEATPIDAVSGTNWEGAGVVPDVICRPHETKGRRYGVGWLIAEMSLISGLRRHQTNTPPVTAPENSISPTIAWSRSVR